VNIDCIQADSGHQFIAGRPMAYFILRQRMLLTNNNGASGSALAGILILLASVAGLALLGWVTIIMLDLKHLNTSGFTLP
jgi:hypothetical protein